MRQIGRTSYFNQVTGITDRIFKVTWEGDRKSNLNETAVDA